MDEAALAQVVETEDGRSRFVAGGRSRRWMQPLWRRWSKRKMDAAVSSQAVGAEGGCSRFSARVRADGRSRQLSARKRIDTIDNRVNKPGTEQYGNLVL